MLKLKSKTVQKKAGSSLNQKPYATVTHMRTQVSHHNTRLILLVIFFSLIFLYPFSGFLLNPASHADLAEKPASSALFSFVPESQSLTSEERDAIEQIGVYFGISAPILQAIANLAEIKPPVHTAKAQSRFGLDLVDLSQAQQKLLFISSKQLKVNSPLYEHLHDIFKNLIPFDFFSYDNEHFSVISDSAGNILLATVSWRHHLIEAIRYTDSQGHTGYYTPSGQALFTSFFLAAPVNYTRISDRFKVHRWHPILHITRPHYGIDYVAAAGTPIRAIASGRIRFAGWAGGYGKSVVITHNERYQSLYAHMSHIAYSIKPGQWVAQGQIIGYVGSSGLTTGPHLHFGLYESGRAINPEKILPKFSPPTEIAQNDFPDFLAKTNQLRTQLADAQNHNTTPRVSKLFRDRA